MNGEILWLYKALLKDFQLINNFPKDDIKRHFSHSYYTRQMGTVMEKKTRSALASLLKEVKQDLLFLLQIVQ